MTTLSTVSASVDDSAAMEMKYLPESNRDCTETDVETVPGNSRERESRGTNYVQTLMNMLNGFIGSGILTMPLAFKDAGLLVASIFNPLIGLLSCTCIHMLLHINRHAMRVNKTTVPYTYPELGREAFAVTPAWSKYSNIGKIFVTTAVISTNLGCCCVYFVFIGVNLEQVSLFWKFRFSVLKFQNSF